MNQWKEYGNYLQEALKFAKPIAKAIESSFYCNRVSMVTVGLEVPHAHIHLVPMNKMQDLNFSNERLKLTPEEYHEIQERIINQ